LEPQTDGKPTNRTGRRLTTKMMNRLTDDDDDADGQNKQAYIHKQANRETESARWRLF